MARVGFNAHLYSSGASYRAAGVSRYVQKLLTYLPQVDRTLSWVAFLGDARAHFAGWDERISRWPTERPAVRILWEQLVQPWQAIREKLDLLHAPGWVGPLMAPCPLVVTIHDLSFFVHPELFRPFNRAYLQRMTPHTARRAARLIVSAESTRADVLRILGLPPEKLVVIPDGVGEEMAPIADRAWVEAWRRRRGLPERMILFLGTLEPRKNIVTLLEAYALLRRRSGFAHRLVVAGAQGWYYEHIYARVDELGLRDEVLFPGYVPQEELALWYNAADLFVLPSLYEGFGLPALEAMACGTPVIVSNVSSLPEVVGEAGLILPPSDAQAWATAIWDVLEDEQRRRAMREAGLARARLYSWRATALATARVYHQVLEERGYEG